MDKDVVMASSANLGHSWGSRFAIPPISRDVDGPWSGLGPEKPRPSVAELRG